jgi:hypothetical protein
MNIPYSYNLYWSNSAVWGGKITWLIKDKDRNFLQDILRSDKHLQFAYVMSLKFALLDINLHPSFNILHALLPHMISYTDPCFKMLQFRGSTHHFIRLEIEEIIQKNF